MTLRPGQSRTVTVTARTPASPGDEAASILFSTRFNAYTTTIPVTLRSMVDVAAGGTFNGTLTGSVVSGTLYVDDFISDTPPYGQQGADELAAIPYTYTVG